MLLAPSASSFTAAVSVVEGSSSAARELAIPLAELVMRWRPSAAAREIAGARAFGMTSVRYRGASDDTEDLPDADHVIDHHAQLLAIVDQPM